jgi:pimeloyl-ACP methyl ester carboxylesterase
VLYAFSSKYRVVAPDLRGYGETQRAETSGFPWPLNCGKRSRGSAVDDYSLENLVEDIRALILELGHTECVLVSHGALE